MKGADAIRYGLVFGSGDVLEDAVASALRAAGFRVIDLDDDLGDTISADLLVADDADRWLVEVKFSGGSAPEKHVGALLKHLETWPQIRPDEPVVGGVLISNHNFKLDPSERPLQVYSRPEFLASLKVPVIGSLTLFDLWRTGDWAGLRALIATGQPQAASRQGAEPEAAPPTNPTGDCPSRPRRRLGRPFR